MARSIYFYRICSLLTALILSISFSVKSQEIEIIVNSISSERTTEITHETVQAKAIVRLFYQQRNYTPAWPQTNEISQVLEAIKQSDEEGLYKEDYHYESLVKLVKMYQNSIDISDKNKILAEFDVLLTDAVMLYAFHLINGKVDPNDMDTAWNYSHKSLLPQVVIDHLTHALNNGNIAAGLDKFKPEFSLYIMLKKGLGEYSALAQNKTFITIPEKTLRAGSNDPAVQLLRDRLALEGFDAATTCNARLYDQVLKKQVIEFQQLHGLDPDGIVGLATIRELNVTFAQRADQIRINLERTRWVHSHMKDDFILVNIPGYQLYVVNDNKLVWKTDVMVGKQTNVTETFRASMFYMVFNPTWTVPRSIMRKGLIEKVVADPTYLVKHNFVLLDRKGQEVATKTVNWEGLGLDNFPYSIKQLPGTHNALGRVKFIFPNKHAIYLHDTPATALFDKTQRAFSSGCVRVKNPLKLAELLLNDPIKWSKNTIKQTIDSKQMIKVELPIKSEVMLMYWTAEPHSSGRIKFNLDIYDRDKALMAQFIKY